MTEINSNWQRSDFLLQRNSGFVVVVLVDGAGAGVWQQMARFSGKASRLPRSSRG